MRAGSPLVGDAFAGQLQPAVQVGVVGEQLDQRPVGRLDVLRVAGERRPAERAAPLLEERPDVGGDEAGEGERPVVAALAGLVADRVAVVEDLGARVLEADHRLDVTGHGGAGPLGEGGGVGGGQRAPLLDGDALGQVGERVVGRGLVGDDVDRRAPAQQFGEDLGGVPGQADRERAAGVAGLGGQAQGVVQVVGGHVQVAAFQAAGDAGRVGLDAEGDAVVHGDGERLGAAHPAEPGGEGDRPGEAAVEPLAGDGAEGLEGALEDALAADVDPRTGRHLAVHDEPALLQAAELLPVGPVADQVRVGDEHARRPLAGPQHPDRLAGLHQQRLVVSQRAQGPHDRVVRLPVPGRLAGAAVDHQLLGVLGHLRVQVVHQHPQRALLLPAETAERGAVGGTDGGVRGNGAHCCLLGWAGWTGSPHDRARRRAGPEGAPRNLGYETGGSEAPPTAGPVPPPPRPPRSSRTARPARPRARPRPGPARRRRR